MAWSVAGAVLPDLPAFAGAIWLGTRRWGGLSGASSVRRRARRGLQCAGRCPAFGGVGRRPASIWSGIWREGAEPTPTGEAAGATSPMIACSTPRSRTPGMRARSSGHSQGTASRVLSPTGGTVTTTPAPSRSSSTRHCSWLRCSSCHGFLLTRSGLGTALIRFRVRCFEEGWMLAKEEVL